MSLFSNFHHNRPCSKSWIVGQTKLVGINRICQAYIFVAPYDIITRVLDIHMDTSIGTSWLQVRVQNQNSIMNQVAGLVDTLVRLD